MSVPILFLDGADRMKSFEKLARQILHASLVVIRHPKKRHLYEIAKSNYTDIPRSLVKLKTVNKHVAATLQNIK